MKRLILFVICLLTISIQLKSQIVVNEMMYAPSDATNEWFELYNIGPVPVNIQNWKWRDLQNAPLRTLTTQSIFIEPGGYVVVCQDTTKFKNEFPEVPGVYMQSIGWSALNNTGNDGVILYTADSVLVDSTIYNSSWGGSGGFSLERIDPAGPSNSQSNWGTSISPNRATPNMRNSITPLNNNLWLRSFSITPVNPIVGGSIQMNLVVTNIGLETATDFSINVYNNPSLDSNIQNSILLTSQQYSNLATGDSILFSFNIDNLDSGIKQYIGYVFYPLDEDTTNNFLVRRITVGGDPIVVTGLVINEIMYAPVAPELEWFEIYNNSEDHINLQNWKWKDATAPLRTITTETAMLAPFEYAVICQDSVSMRQIHPDITGIVLQSTGWSALNNTGDDVILIAPDDSRVDSVAYLSSWGGSSRNSLERIDPAGPSNDPSNWATSIACNFSTPNQLNSVSNITPYEPGDVAINEIMFQPFSGEAEWIEIYNVSNKNINMNGWVINESNRDFPLSDTCDFILPPGGYIVLSGDTTIFQRFSYLLEYSPVRRTVIAGSAFNLSNSGEPVLLKDAAGTIIDSVYYLPGWRNPNLTSSLGVSLERINPSLGSNDRSNWSSCTNPLGGTPGLRNSIYLDIPSPVGEITIAPNPFSPDGDGFEDFTIISYKLKSLFAQVRVKVFDVKGRLVRTLANNILSGSEGQIIFDGRDDDQRKLRLGIYVVFLEAIDDQGGVVETLKAPVVVATKL